MNFINNCHSNPFLSLPSEITTHIFSYCEGHLTSKISAVCKSFLNLERDEALVWKTRVIKLMGLEMGKQFKDTFNGWKQGYINFYKMSQEGHVISPTKVIDGEGNCKEGVFINGKVNGQGAITFADGAKWEGEFKEGELIKGKITSEDGESCTIVDKERPFTIDILTQNMIHSKEGLDSELSGEGFITYYDKTIHLGKFVNGKLNGPGKMIFSDGMIVEGEFENDRLYGEGTITGTTGTVVMGYFEDSKLKGIVKIVHPNGDISFNICDDIPHI